MKELDILNEQLSHDSVLNERATKAETQLNRFKDAKSRATSLKNNALQGGMGIKAKLLKDYSETISLALEMMSPLDQEKANKKIDTAIKSLEAVMKQMKL
jgi:hypothetical protein